MPNIFDRISGFVFTHSNPQSAAVVLHELDVDVIQHQPTGFQLFGLFVCFFLWCCLKISVLCAAVTLPSASPASAFVVQLVVMMLVVLIR